jgi:hypothetical protein
MYIKIDTVGKKIRIALSAIIASKSSHDATHSSAMSRSQPVNTWTMLGLSIKSECNIGKLRWKHCTECGERQHTVLVHEVCSPHLQDCSHSAIVRKNRDR